MGFKILQALRREYKKQKIKDVKEIDCLKNLTRRQLEEERDLIYEGKSRLSSRQRKAVINYFNNSGPWKKKIKI